MTTAPSRGDERKGTDMDLGPFRIKLADAISSELPGFIINGGPLSCPPGEHDAYANRHGAVSVVCPDGRQLGCRPGEFEYVTLPPAGVPLAMTPGQVRALADELEALRAARRVDAYANAVVGVGADVTS